MKDLERGTERYSDRQLDTAPYTKIYLATIVEFVDGVGYTVKVNGVLYTGVNAIATSTFLNRLETVGVGIPNNQYSNMFILGK